MKTKYNIIGVIVISAILLILFWYIEMGRSFSWMPPSTEFHLEKNEINWKKQIESKYECSINFIGLDSGFEEDSITYLNISFKDNSILNEKLDEELEMISNKISSSFISSTSGKRKQTYILIKYIYSHNYNNDTIATNIPKERYCLYDIINKNVLPTYKKLIIPKFGYFDFYEKENDLFYYKLGGQLKNYLNCSIQQDSILKYYNIKEPIKFKELDNCVSYTSKKKYLIDLNKAYIESTHTFVFFENECVSVDINYRCFPKSNDIESIDFIKKVTEISPERLKYSKPEKLNLINKLKGNNYNLDKKIFGVNVHFKVDTLKKPWQIKYGTSLDDIRFYRTFNN